MVIKKYFRFQLFSGSLLKTLFLLLFSGGLLILPASAQDWSFMKGYGILPHSATYGTQGVAAAANTPGARDDAISWESNGKYYLFGGYSYGYLNDLWEYDPATNNWRWLKGSNTPNQPGNYGTQGISAAVNTPGARYSAVSWESNGKLYLFGGSLHSYGVYYNDLWEYDTVTNNWRWLKGGNTPNQPGIYGTLGIAASANTPGARHAAVSWENNGKLYVFGGGGGSGYYNDLWEYDTATNNWRWLKGGNTPYQPGNQNGTYGTQGVATAANTPGARYGAVSWESNGKLYLFGGFRPFEDFGGELFNDLWEYDPATNNWRWLKGSNTINQVGIYGTQGITAPANTPGARKNAVSWESNGKLYLFGGSLHEYSVYYNDLWEYDPVTNNWRWLKGGNTPNQPGIYGTLGIAASANTPGARYSAVTWESNGKLHLYGGSIHSYGGDFNDLWEYDPVTNNWRWLTGSNATGQSGTYGTQGIAATGNTPGARQRAVSWESNGKFYLFGGVGYAASSSFGFLNDLWEYDPATNNWRWLKGGNIPYQPGTYGTQGIAAAANTPGSRYGAVSWERNGKLYLFGGRDYQEDEEKELFNDLWEFDPVTNNWRWLKGSNTINQVGTYGTQGIAAAANTPGARWGAVSWENNGKLYLFGGGDEDGNGSLNDLWEYDLATNNWRWLKGSNATYQSGIYGTQGTVATANTPGSREDAITWESSGKFYLFGGYGEAASTFGPLNDLWEYDPSNNNWRWLKGSNVSGQNGTYGTHGIADSANTPGAREGAISWKSHGKLCLFGGYGYAASSSGYLNDIWEYNPATNNWRWLKGSNNPNQSGTFVTQGIPAAANTPGARYGAVGWENNGQIYLFGGAGYGLDNDISFRGDLWAAQLPTLPNDVAVSAITSVNSGCGLTNQETITITVNNWGTAAQSNIPVSYKINNGTPVNEVVVGPLAPNSSVNYSFITKANLSAPSTYNIDARTSLTNDSLPTNDTFTKVVQSYGIPAVPTITAAGPTTFCAGGSVVLTAASATTGVTYTWFKDSTAITGANAATYIANATGNYTAVASANGCSSATSGATAVTVNAYPVVQTITASGPTSFCSGDSVTLTVSTTTSGATFQWFKDSNIIPGATTMSCTASVAGSYSVMVTANSCSNTHLASIVTITPIPNTPTITQAGFVLTSSSTTGNQWYKDNVAITGSTAQSYTANSNGSYTVIVTDNGCPSSASNAVVIYTTGVGADLKGLDVFVYPNPSHGLFTISLPEGSSYELTVTDLTGKAIRQLTTNHKLTQLTISGAAKGVYLLKIAGESKTTMRKLVVE